MRWPILLLFAATAAQAAEGLSLREAIALGLARHPDVQLQRSAEQLAAGLREASRAPFDTTLTAAAARTHDLRPLRADEQLRFGAAGVEQELLANSLALTASRLLDSGLLLGASYARSDTRDELQWAQNIPSQRSDRLGFTLKLPLRRNPGQEAAAARAAADLDYDASLRDSEQVAARSVQAVLLAYWDWAAREAAAALATAAAERMARLQRETAKLVAADELPPADLNLLGAALEERRSQQLAQQQRARDGRVALARLFGMDAVASAALAAPAARLPEAAAGVWQELPAQALERRADLAALRLREQAAARRLEAARAATRSPVDLELGAYYAGLHEGTRVNPAAPAPVARYSGPGLSARLSVSLPLNNSGAKGALQVALANLETARLRRSQQEQQVSSAAAAALAGLDSAAAQLAASTRAVGFYRQALNDILNRRQLGSATLIDVLNLEDRLQNALLAQLAQQLAYVQARATLLFESGALLQGAGGALQVAPRATD